MKIPLFNIKLKDGTRLKDCSVFDANYVVIDDRKKAELCFVERLPYNSHVRIQNKFIQGKVSIKGIESWAFSREIEI